MTAAVLGGSDAGPAAGELRAVNPRTDMAAIAELIEASFGEELDPTGRRMVREMRTFGRAGFLGWLIGHLFLPPAAYPRGYVWELAGELVGNASLLPVPGESRRWVLANVAVHPDHRRRGIGRRLVNSCLQLARREGADEVLLQVRSDNTEARRLYRALGFSLLSVRGRWEGRPRKLSITPHNEIHIRQPREGEWRQQWALAQRLFPEGLQWPYPLRRSWFEPHQFPGLLAFRRNRHWVIGMGGGQLRASLTARFSRDSQGWHLALLVRPSDRGVLELPLLRQALRDLQPTGLAVAFSYPTSIIDEELGELGFRCRRTLAWMGKHLSRPPEGSPRNGPVR